MPASTNRSAVYLVLAVAGSVGCRGPAPAAATTPMAATTPAGLSAHHDPHAHAHAHHRFDDVARWSAIFDDPQRAAWQRPDEVARLCELAPGQVAVDLGAGTGYFLAPLSAGVGPTGRVLGLDVEATMVAHMTARAAREGLANVTARRVAGDDPGLAPASVDRVLIVDTWHHLPDRAAYAVKLAAALRPGGRIVVVDFTPETAKGPPPAARIAAQAVVAELAAAGLTAAVVSETLPDQYVVVGRR